MVVADEQDGAPPVPSGNPEGTVDNHTDTPPAAEGDTGGDRLPHPDTTATKQASVHPVLGEQTSIADPIDVVMRDEPKECDTDLLFRIRGLYRLLDLINEQGSGGAGATNVP